MGKPIDLMNSYQIEIGYLRYEKNFFKDMVQRTKHSIERLAELKEKNDRKMQQLKDFQDFNYIPACEVYYYAYSTINDNPETGNLDPLNFKERHTEGELTKKDDLSNFLAIIEEENQNIDGIIEKFNKRLFSLEDKLKKIKELESKNWDEFNLYMYENEDKLNDYIKFQNSKIVIENKPNLKYTQRMFDEYWYEYSVNKLTQEDAAIKILTIHFGSYFEKEKKASVESFLKAMRKPPKK